MLKCILSTIYLLELNYPPLTAVKDFYKHSLKQWHFILYSSWSEGKLYGVWGFTSCISHSEELPCPTWSIHIFDCCFHSHQIFPRAPDYTTIQRIYLSTLNSVPGSTSLPSIRWLWDSLSVFSLPQGNKDYVHRLQHQCNSTRKAQY